MSFPVGVLQDGLDKLDRTFTLDKDGNLVTMREYIAAYGHEKVRASVGNPVVDPARGIKKADELTVDDLFKLAEAFVLEGKDNTAVTSGRITYTKQQQLDSIRQRTGWALGFVPRVRDFLRLKEAAIEQGLIEFIDTSAGLEPIPLDDP